MSQDNIKKWYLDNYKKFEEVVSADKLSSSRNDASNNFENSEFPTRKDEEWKYTNISPILKHEFIPAPLNVSKESKLENIETYRIPNLDVHLMVFINGIFNKEHSELGQFGDGIIVDSFYNQTKTNADFLDAHISKSEKSDNSFNLLNTTFAYDGFVVFIPKNKVIEKPIHILNIASDNVDKPLIQPKNLIVAEENSQAKIITEYVGSKNSEYFTNVVTDIKIAENANVTFYKLQKNYWGF